MRAYRVTAPKTRERKFFKRHYDCRAEDAQEGNFVSPSRYRAEDAREILRLYYRAEGAREKILRRIASQRREKHFESPSLYCTKDAREKIF